MEEYKERISVSAIEYRRDPDGIYELYAEKIYSQFLELCQEFNCYGRFVKLSRRGEKSGLYFIAGSNKDLVKRSDPIEVLRKMKECVEPDSYYLPIFSLKLGFVRPVDELDELWNYLDAVEFLAMRCNERMIRLPERIDKTTLFWLINSEKEQLNPRYPIEIKAGEKRIQESNYQDLKMMTESPGSLMGKCKKFASDPRSLVTKFAGNSKIIHFFHFLRWNNRQRVSFRILKRMGGLSGIDINKKNLKAFKQELKKYPYILYHQDRLPYITNLGELKGVPDEQNPWAGQTRKIVKYPFMFLTIHLPMVEAISRKVVREAEKFHDVSTEELKKMGKTIPILIPKHLEKAFDYTCCLNDIPYAIDYTGEHNEFSERSIPALILEKNILAVMNYIMNTKYGHTLNPVTMTSSWRIREREISIDYTQNEEVAAKYDQKIFEWMLSQKQLNEKKKEASQQIDDDTRQKLEERRHLLKKKNSIIENENIWF